MSSMRHVYYRMALAKAKNVASLRGKVQEKGKAVLLPEYNHATTEFEVQSYLLNQLLSAGMKVRGEVPTKCGKSRFDLVIFNEHLKPSVIIEVKRAKKDTKSLPKAEAARLEQLERYKSYGIQVVVIFGMKDATRYLKRIGVIKREESKSNVVDGSNEEITTNVGSDKVACDLTQENLQCSQQANG